MGKVAKPLTIVVFPPLDEWPEIQKLQKQGHTILSFKPIPGGFRTLGADCVEDAISLMVEADIILGPRCWYMTELHRKHLTQAIKQARLRKYGTITKKRKKGNDDEKVQQQTSSELGSGDTDNSVGPDSSGC